MDRLPSGEIADWTARDLSRAIHARAVSCVEAMAAILDRIDRLNPAVNAIVAPRPREAVLAEAAAADAELAAGRSRGWLHGMPQAPKDLTGTVDIATAMGSPILAGRPADVDSILVERLRGAGAILIGKTLTHEFAWGITSVWPSCASKNTSPVMPLTSSVVAATCPSIRAGGSCSPR